MEKVKEFFDKMNTLGIPLLFLRDPKTGKASITATMFVVTHWLAILLLLGKVTKVLGDVDYANVLWLYGLTGSFYLGRKMSGDGKNISIGETVDKKEEQ